MAIVKYGGGVAEFRGSIGGVTFSRNKAGTISRIRKKPRYKATSEAQRMSVALAYYTGLWHDVLNAGQRTAWRALAAATVWVNRLGDNYSPSGLNLYVRSNCLLHLAEDSRQDTAPGSADEASPVFTLDYVAGVGIRMTNIGTLATPPVGFVLMSSSGNQRLSKTTFYSPWRFYYAPTVAGMGPPIVIMPNTICVALTRWFFRFRVIRSSGMATPAFFAYQDCPAVL